MAQDTNNQNNGKDKEVKLTKSDIRLLEAKILSKYNELFRVGEKPIKSSKQIKFNDLVKLANGGVNGLQDTLNKLLVAGTFKKISSWKCFNLSNEIAVALQPHFKDVKIDESILDNRIEILGNKVLTILNEELYNPPLDLDGSKIKLIHVVNAFNVKGIPFPSLKSHSIGKIDKFAINQLPEKAIEVLEKALKNDKGDK